MLANKHLGEVAFPGVAIPGFEGGGIILFDFYALALTEDAFKTGIEEVGMAMLTSPNAMITAFQAALNQHHNVVDTRTAAKIIQALKFQGVAAEELLKDSFLICFPEAVESDDANPPQGESAAPGTSKSASKTGSRSGGRKKRSGGSPRAGSRLT